MSHSNTKKPVGFRRLCCSGAAALLLGVLAIACGIQSKPTEAQPPRDFTLTYTLDRSAVPRLTYNDLTLRIFIGQAATVSARVDGAQTPVRYDRQSGYATLTTSGSRVEVQVHQVFPTEKLGAYSKTALKEDYKWAWSHGFDDNVQFKEKGIPAFDSYGWRATVYIIGSKLSDTRDENWIVDRVDLIKLVQKGWAIGNHGWNHDTVQSAGGAEAAAREIQRLDIYLRGVVRDAGRPDYRLMSFAAPAFDSDYLPVLLRLRDSRAVDLLFDESGSSSFIRVDRGASEPPNSSYSPFDPNNAVGRDYRIDEFGTGSEYDKAFRRDIAAMSRRLDADHHYWLNTFTHDVDGKADGTSVIAFLPWIDQHYGPHGDKSVWVAPAEEIYSYLLVRDGVKIDYHGPNAASVDAH